MNHRINDVVLLIQELYPDVKLGIIEHQTLDFFYNNRRFLKNENEAEMKLTSEVLPMNVQTESTSFTRFLETFLSLCDIPVVSSKSLDGFLGNSGSNSACEYWDDNVDFPVIGSMELPHLNCYCHNFQLVCHGSLQLSGVNHGFQYSFCDDTCYKVCVLHVQSHHMVSFLYLEFLRWYYMEKYPNLQFRVHSLVREGVSVLGIVVFGRTELEVVEDDEVIDGRCQTKGMFQGLYKITRQQVSEDSEKRARMSCINVNTSSFQKDFGKLTLHSGATDSIISILTDLLGYMPVYDGNQQVSFVRTMESHCVCGNNNRANNIDDNILIDFEQVTCGIYNDCMLRQLVKLLHYVCNMPRLDKEEIIMKQQSRDVELQFTVDTIRDYFTNTDNIANIEDFHLTHNTDNNNNNNNNNNKNRNNRLSTYTLPAYLLDSVSKRRKGILPSSSSNTNKNSQKPLPSASPPNPGSRVPQTILHPSAGVYRMGILVPRPQKPASQPRYTKSGSASFKKLTRTSKEKKTPQPLDEAVARQKYRDGLPEQPVPPGCTRLVPTPLQYLTRGGVPVSSNRQTNLDMYDYVQCNKGNAYHPCGDSSHPGYISEASLVSRNSSNVYQNELLLLSVCAVEMVRLTNKYRAMYDQPPVQWDSRLAEIAYPHSKDMGLEKVPFEHVGFNHRVKQVPYAQSGVWENQALASHSRSELALIMVEGWIRSPPHRKALQSNSTHCGIGVYVNSQGVHYATQLFAKKA